MPRKFLGVGAVVHYCEYASAILTATPITFSCWFSPADVTGSMALMAISDSVGTNYFTFGPSLNVAGKLSVQTGGSGHAESSTSYVANTWQHALGVFDTGTTGAVYLNGGSKGTFTGGSTQGAVDKTDIGVLNAGGFFSKCNALIAQAAIWNVALGDTDAARLAAGVHPTRVRGGNLLALWELTGPNMFLELDSMHGRHMTVVKPTPLPVGLGPRKLIPVPRHWALTVPAGDYVPYDLAHTPQHQAIMAM